MMKEKMYSYSADKKTAKSKISLENNLLKLQTEQRKQADLAQRVFDDLEKDRKAGKITEDEYLKLKTMYDKDYA
jgi:hypothetical protein